MAKCDICGKGVSFGIKVSHSHRRSNRTWKANIKKVRAVVNGNTKSVNVCTRCLRSGKVTRAVWFRKNLAEEFCSSVFFLQKIVKFQYFFCFFERYMLYCIWILNSVFLCCSKICTHFYITTSQGEWNRGEIADKRR